MKQNLINFLIEAEGFERQPYKDSAGYLTIGVGHKLTLEERNRNSVFLNGDYVPYEAGLSVMQVQQLLEQDLQSYEAVVIDSLKVEVNANQYIALVSLCFNIGTHAFQNSKLIRHLNNGRFDRIPYEFMKWIHVKKEVDKGLIRRRTKELVMWLKCED